MPIITGLRVCRIEQKQIDRFRLLADYLNDYLKKTDFPAVERQDKTRPCDKSVYTLEEVFPPEWIDFGLIPFGTGINTICCDILNQKVVAAFIGASDKYVEGVKMGYTDKGTQLSSLLAGAVIEYGNSLVVSGGAFGIDRASHKGALDAGGRTAAVVQNPAIYGLSPLGKNEIALRLQSDIPLHGGFVSVKEEYAKPTKSRAMERNYITSALSDIVVVVECWEGSGTIDNALKAMLQGKRVVVIDWDNIEEGGNKIRQGNAWLLKQRTPHRNTPCRFPEHKVQDIQQLGPLFKEYLEEVYK